MRRFYHIDEFEKKKKKFLGFQNKDSHFVV